MLSLVVVRAVLRMALVELRKFVAWSWGKDLTFRVDILDLVAVKESEGLDNGVSVQVDAWEQWKSTVVGAIEVGLVSLRRTGLVGQAAHSVKQVWKAYQEYEDKEHRW